MYNNILKRVLSLSAFLLIFSAIAWAQTGPIEGIVKVRQADGSTQPVPEAIVDIFRVDIKGSWEVKADKKGHYVRLGLPLVGRYIVVASGPGIQPTWINGIRLSQVSVVDIIANPGDGSRLTFEQVIGQIRGGGATPPPAATVSAADRAKAEEAKKELDAKRKEAEELQNAFDSARERYNKGVELTKLKTPESTAAALVEFEAAAAIDPSKHKDFSELAYKANANAAMMHRELGGEKFNNRDREGAKPHFEKAVSMATRAIEIASASASPTAANDIIIYYNSLIKNQLVLIEHYGAADRADATVDAITKIEALDAANKAKWGVMRGDVYRFIGKSEEAAAAYKAVLMIDPANLDSLFNLGLTYLASVERASLQQSANYLEEFVSKAPADDPRVPAAKDSLRALKNEFKVEAEKPSKRRGKP